MILLPIVSSFGLVTNSFIIIAISIQDTKKHLKANHYAYIRLYAIFNLLILFLDIFLPFLSECQTHAGIYCSQIRHFLGVQYLKIIFGEYFSSVLRMASNFAYVGFSLNRLSLIGKDHGKVITFFSKTSSTKYILVCLIPSVILSLSKAFHYQVNKVDTSFYDNDLQQYPIEFNRNLKNVFSSNYKILSRLIRISNSIVDITNSLLFILINLILDIILIFKLKKTLSERIIVNLKSNELIINRTVRLVTFYAIFSVLLKLPSCAISLIESINPTFFFFFRVSFGISLFFENFCLHARFCFMFTKLAETLFALSLSTAIFFFYSFDNKFALAIIITKSRLFSDRATHRKLLASLET